jgi:hypothetical protein
VEFKPPHAPILEFANVYQCTDPISGAEMLQLYRRGKSGGRHDRYAAIG